MTEQDKAQEYELATQAATTSRLSALILDAWQRTRLDWGFVSDRLADSFRKQRGLGSRERRYVAEAVYGMVRHLRRIDEALRLGGLTSADRAPDRDRLLAYLVLESGLTVQDAARERPALDWQRVASIDEKLARETDPVRKIGLRHSLPDWLSQVLLHDLGERAEAVAAALNTRAPMTIRVNTLRASVAEVVERLRESGIETRPGQYSPSALMLETRTNLFSLPAFKQGLFEAQDEGSQLIAELVAPPPKARVVDYCAGAGGKTLALAALMHNRGRIVATDIDARKLQELARRARRGGVGNVQSAVVGETFPPALVKLEGAAHRVLIDAPCSGLGALRRNPEARWRLSPADLERLPAQQLAICQRAASLVAPGGRLIYATCTLTRRENQEVVSAFLRAHPGFELMPVKAIWGSARAAQVADEDGRHLSVSPDRQGTDGFFAAVLRRMPEAGS